MSIGIMLCLSVVYKEVRKTLVQLQLLKVHLQLNQTLPNCSEKKKKFPINTHTNCIKDDYTEGWWNNRKTPHVGPE